MYLHFVWGTWNREPLITARIERDLHRSIEAISRENGCDVLAIGGTEDHVHLLVGFPNTLTFGTLMRRVKSGSSKYTNEELVDSSSFRWQGNYGAFSVSPSHRRKVIEYIENQKEHHATGHIWPHAEETFILDDELDSDLAVVSAQADTRREAPPSEGLQPLATTIRATKTLASTHAPLE